MKLRSGNRIKRVTIRLTSYEKHLIYMNAKKSKMRPSKYLRYCLFNNSKITDPQETTYKMKVATLNDKLQPLEAKYKGMGNNLNQIVKQTHIYGLASKEGLLLYEVREAQKQLKSLDDDVQRLKF